VTAWPAGPTRLGWREALVAWLAFSGVALLLYEPALHGPLLSDDWIYFVNRPYMEALTAQNVATILDPGGDPVVLTWNWAPLHLLAHSLLRALFGSYRETYPHHVTNVVLHAGNATLLLALLATRGVPLLAAAVGALLFLLHPANVEAVAWIFQLKTLLSFSCGMAALLLLVRHPAWATLLFGLGLLVKPSAAAVLAAAIVFEWLRTPGAGEPPQRTAWLVAWAALFAAYALPEWSAFRNTGEFRLPVPVEERLPQAVAIVGRYTVLALSSFGASTFHQPLPPASLLDPWFALGLVTLLGLGTLGVLALWQRHPAAPWLGLSAASYTPVAQLFAFRYPMGDRYLYFVLAGLIGAALVSAAPRLGLALAALRARGPRAAPGLLVLAAGTLALGLGFAVHTHSRAAVFGSAERFERDAALHYPEGLAGQLSRARRALAQGDVAGTLDALEAAHRKGYRNALLMLSDPSFGPLRGEPRFRELARTMARAWIAHFETLPRVGPDVLVDLVHHQLLLGDADAALATLARLEGMPERLEPAFLRRLRRDVERAIEQEQGAP
jgi:hypothetical protein